MNLLFAVLAFSGITYHASYAPLISEVQEGQPAAEAGVQPGDLILAVDGNEIDLWVEFVDYISQRPGETVNLLVDRDGAEIELRSAIARFDTTITTFQGKDSTIVWGRIGVARDTVKPRHAYGIIESLSVGTRQTLAFSGLVLDFLGQLVTGQA